VSAVQGPAPLAGFFLAFSDGTKAPILQIVKGFAKHSPTITKYSPA
jgi:hypothetical protein